ncbi:catalase/peroxidase HPI [Teredinibacter turnerae]|uniref:catalase/peroxidase HPI n=1 Tax=Teredinibacter turnerae TaxID=2426 RepID=UPI00036816DF|nr:catalase/peroxidase HPI [Teredinibacter turnerae]
MNNRFEFFSRFCSSVTIALTLTCSHLYAKDAPMSKPSGTVGMGTVAPTQVKSNLFWWPDQLDLSPLRDHDARSNPLGKDFNYKKAFAELDMAALKQDIDAVLTNSQDWWPADWGNYGPFFIRMTWHAAGTYRTMDGRGGAGGGQQRFDPLNSWPDNGNLDKARRLLWPVKQKYGEHISWGDLIVLAGNVALENMGFKTYGFAAGRDDDWEPDMVYWGPEVEMLASDRRETDGTLKKPLAAVHMGLIYVNPEGPGGVPDPVASAKNIREAFARMAMNDEETLALIAGGHTFGKMHGAHKAKDCLAPEPGAAPVEQQGLGWKNRCGKGNAEDTITSGLEGAWTQAPTRWTSLYLSNLLTFDWKKTRSPAGAIIWIPTDESVHNAVPDAHVKGKFNPPVMTTADLALKFDPTYRKIAERFLANPEEYQLAFAKAWFKLTHRDMGPMANYLGKDFPATPHLWQDPIPDPGYQSLSKRDIAKLKKAIAGSGLSVRELVSVAWASASTYRDSDMRGGANGARIALLPQKQWAANDPESTARVINQLKKVQQKYKKVSLADLIVLGGAVGIERAAAAAGTKVKVPFAAGRGDAVQEHTDIHSFALLEPEADGFRNYYTKGFYKSPTEALVDKADQLALTVPEMTVLVGGLRVLGVNTGNSPHGVFTDRPGVLSNDFFVNLLDMSFKWQREGEIYHGIERKTGKRKFTATPVDLIFGSSSELRAVAEVYAFDNAQERFVNDFVDAWVKVMQADRFDLR